MRMELVRLLYFCTGLGGLACGTEGLPSSPGQLPQGTGSEPSPEPADRAAPGGGSSSVGATPRGGNEQPPAPVGVAGSTESGPPDVAATPGDCSSATLAPGDDSETLEHDGQSREFLVHVPSSYDGATAVPLVLDIHGLTSSARQQAAISGWRRKADEEGFIVVHPQGLDASWNAGSLCCGNSQRSGVDDEGFLRAVVRRLESEACIDARRVYATGLSNGGGMSHLLACNAADLFAATAPVSMGNGTLPCQPARPISVVMTRGTQDPLVPFDGGLFPSAAE